MGTGRVHLPGYLPLVPYRYLTGTPVEPLMYPVLERVLSVLELVLEPVLEPVLEQVPRQF